MGRRSRKRSRLKYYIAIAGLALLIGAIASQIQTDDRNAANASGTRTVAPTSIPAHENVMVIGGSIARGRKDPNENSYIRRAFAALAASSHTAYAYSDRTLIGGTAASRLARKPNEFSTWLHEDNPTVVVISWGLMSDLYAKTPIPKFEYAIHREIQQALKAHAVVFIVTPPVVKPLATTSNQRGERLIRSELNVAAQFHNPNVYTFDLFDQMMTYMSAHHQTYKVYYGDDWHPNALGHKVGGELFYQYLAKTFGTTPILFVG